MIKTIDYPSSLPNPPPRISIEKESKCGATIGFSVQIRAIEALSCSNSFRALY